MAEVELRHLSRRDVIALGGGDIARAVEDVTEVLRLMRAGEAAMPAETAVALAGSQQAKAYALAARVAGRFGAAGVKWTAHRPPALDGAPQILSLTLVNDLATGRPRGLVESALLTATRTAAVSALALCTVAPQRPRRVAVLGAGVQARAHLAMLAALFPTVEEVAIWNRSPDRRKALVAAIRPAAPWPIRLADDLSEITSGDVDAILACTGAPQPILGRGAVRPGRILLQIGYHEVEFDAIDDADAVVVDLWGDFARTSAKSLFQMHRAGRFPAERVAADLAAAVLDGWRPAPGAAVYTSSFGLNVFDIALAARVLARAEAEGIGWLLPMSGDERGDWPWP
ncbi:ornithine cyclodeaminase [Mycobacterium sp. KBS0706]|uniref:ornithine cyclodeaminase n=1 Tax=Mycobacterium sp. KBS0706 TaxID=2578109 RepID=UPI00110FAD17|nr:ornithine cyclodeaminase [Mycobacterium sp. KBS0706]TSD85576.1 ornithine cyclodeaminase [Mycobacterium sp. KBS0706]